MSYSTDQVMMTLSAMAYQEEFFTIEKLLEGKKGFLATQAIWKNIWGPHKKETNLAYLVQKEETNEHALSIRGTAPLDPFSWFLDFETSLVDLPWSSLAPGAKISRGMSKIWRHLTTMPDVGEPHLPEILDRLAAGSIVYVTGHSQGGSAASMMALWIQDAYPELDVRMYSFAGETAGNAAFAQAVESKLPKSYRFVNQNDLVPRAFADLDSMPDLYSSVGISLSNTSRLLFEKFKNKVGDEYAQPFAATLVPKARIYPPNPEHRRPHEEFLEEAAAQHSNIRYLWTMDAPYEPLDPSWHEPSHLEH